jgi:hypothetical protein
MSLIHVLHNVTCTPISRQHPKYAHATLEKVLQKVFSMWSAVCPLLSNGSLNIPADTNARKNRTSIAR